MSYSSGPLHPVLNGQSPHRARMTARASAAIAATNASRAPSPAYLRSIARVTFQHAFAPLRTTASIPSSVRANIARRCISIIPTSPVAQEGNHQFLNLEPVIRDAVVNIGRANCFDPGASKARPVRNPHLGYGEVSHCFQSSRLSALGGSRESHGGETPFHGVAKRQLAASLSPHGGAAAFLRTQHHNPSKGVANMRQPSAGVIVITTQTITGTTA